MVVARSFRKLRWVVTIAALAGLVACTGPDPEGDPAPDSGDGGESSRGQEHSLRDDSDLLIVLDSNGGLVESVSVDVVSDSGIARDVADSLPVGAQLAGPVLELASDRPLSEAVTLVFPVGVNDPPAPSLPVGGVSYLDEATNDWRMVEADWDPDRRALVVVTDHLSLWQMWTWDWGRVVGDISDSIGRLEGQEADAPRCTGVTPEWVSEVVHADAPTSPLLVCGEVDPADPELAIVRIANNRPYSIALTSDETFAWRHVDTPDSVAFVATQLVQAELDASDAVLVPPLTEVALGVRQGDGVEHRIDAQVSGSTLVVDVSLIALDQVGIRDWELVTFLASCAGDEMLALPDAAVSPDYVGRIFGVVGTCLGDNGFLAEASRSGASAASLEQLSLVGRVYSAHQALGLGSGLFVEEMVLYEDDHVTVFARPVAAPSFEELLSAAIPGMCGHEPAQLIGGRDLGLEASEGVFELQHTLADGPAWAVLPDTGDGPMTAVVARCNAGGVGWPNPILFFSNGPDFYSATFLSDYDWGSIGLSAPARDGVKGIRVEDKHLIVELMMLGPDDGDCCPTGSATVALEAHDGRVSVVEVLDYNTRAVILEGEAGAIQACGAEPIRAWLETDRFSVAICGQPGEAVYVGANRDTGDGIRLPACALDDFMWVATNPGHRYEVDMWVDGIPQLRVYDPEGELIVDEPARLLNGSLSYSYALGPAGIYCP